jgi:hypothetical protein
MLPNGLARKGQMEKPEMYFNDLLSSHAGHKLEVVEYCCGFCGATTDYLLRCIQEQIDDTCYDDPAGIAREWVTPEHKCEQILLKENLISGNN